MIVQIMTVSLYCIVTVLVVYTVRHYAFTMNRLFGRNHQPYVDIGAANWPTVTVFVPAHNEEQVIGDMLENLLAVDYPAEKLTIVPINDRSDDATGAIIDSYAARCPGRIVPYHREKGPGGKAAALREVCRKFSSDIFLVFDADYLPGRGLIKQLVAPFFDPEVGAVMGRVVPHNLNGILLTRLLDLERAGGYQVDQQARMNLGLIPQYGGTVGGVRKSALKSVGGWRRYCLAEDTDITMRMVLHGWKVVYQNRSECYEEVPQNWKSRIRQIQRWARGHNQSMFRYTLPLLSKLGKLPTLMVLDGLLLLGVFMVPPLILTGWLLAMALFYSGVPVSHAVVVILGVTTWSTAGNFAAFFEVATAARLDGSYQRVLLLPFLSFGFLVSLMAVSWATLVQILTAPCAESPCWHKTERHRNGNGNGAHGNGSGHGKSGYAREMPR